MFHVKIMVWQGFGNEGLIFIMRQKLLSTMRLRYKRHCWLIFLDYLVFLEESCIFLEERLHKTLEFTAIDIILLPQNIISTG